MSHGCYILRGQSLLSSQCRHPLMSPGPWDPASSCVSRMLPGLPPPGSSGVKVVGCPQALVSRG